MKFEIFNFLSEGDHYHHLPFMVIAYHQRPQQALVGMLVVERQPVLQSIGSYAVADTVVDVIHQVAFFDIQHLVKRTGYMKSQSGLNF